MHKNPTFQHFYSLRFVLYLITLCGLVSLTGCSHLGIGGADYGCQGMPQGVKCLSASEVYHRAVANSSNAVSSPMTSIQSFNEEPLMRVWIYPAQDEEGDWFEGYHIKIKPEMYSYDK